MYKAKQRKVSNLEWGALFVNMSFFDENYEYGLFPSRRAVAKVSEEVSVWRTIFCTRHSSVGSIFSQPVELRRLALRMTRLINREVGH